MSRKPVRRRELGASRAHAGRAGQAFRRYFVTGLATLFPVTVTLWLCIQIFRVADRMLGQTFGSKIPGLGLVVTILVILVVGVFSVHFFGRVLFRTIEALLGRLPFIRKIYPPVKQLAEFLFSDETGKTAFRCVVLVPYPRSGLYTVAFVTNEQKTSVTGRSQVLLTCLLPNPPSPFTGPLIFVPEEDVIPLDLSVEETVKFIVSGGVVASPLRLASSSSE